MQRGCSVFLQAILALPKHNSSKIKSPGDTWQFLSCLSDHVPVCSWLRGNVGSMLLRSYKRSRRSCSLGMGRDSLPNSQMQLMPLSPPESCQNYSKRANSYIFTLCLSTNFNTHCSSTAALPDPESPTNATCRTSSPEPFGDSVFFLTSMCLAEFLQIPLTSRS